MSCQSPAWLRRLFTGATLVLASVVGPANSILLHAATWHPGPARQTRQAPPGSTDSIAVPDIAVPDPDDERRVTAGAVISPATASPGDGIVLFVKVRVATHYWIYGFENSGSRKVPTTVTIARDALRPIGSWRALEPRLKEDGSRTLAGDVLLQRRFAIERRAKAGQQSVPVTIRYQVCNEALCWPATTMSLHASLTVVSR